MLALCIETATSVCSVALLRDKQVVGLKESHRKNSHAEVLTPFIQELLEVNELDVGGLDVVAVSKGPGSYTGLRIGVSSAKGLCYAGEKPLLAINTLESMAAGIIQQSGKEYPENTLFCPMIDARRMEVYCAFFGQDGTEVRETKAEIIDSYSFQDYLEKSKVIFFGDGASKCKESISSPNAIFVDDFFPSASHMLTLVSKRYQTKQFEDVAYFEPFYLKDFVAGVPRVKGLR